MEHRARWFLVGSSLLLAACGPGPRPETFSVDAPTPSDPVPDPPAPSTKFFVLVTETPFGTVIDPAGWGGIKRYDIPNVGAPAVESVGIDKSLLSDPSGMAFRDASAELFVANRHGNNGPGSIARFAYDADTESFAPNGLIQGNALEGVHQIAFSPTTGELFAANMSGGGGASRFTFDANGNAIPNGKIGVGISMRGVAISPDGTRLYATDANNTIAQIDIATGANLGSITVSFTGLAALHYMAVKQDAGTGASHLYVPGVFANTIYRYRILASNDLEFIDALPASTPIGVAFAPYDAELFSASHTGVNVIDRFQPVGSSWSKTSDIPTSATHGSVWTFSASAEPIF